MSTRWSATRPSPWWIVVTVTAVLLGVAAGVGAALYQREASRLVGEGQLLWKDGREALHHAETELATGSTREQVVRSVRNSLQNEAVALVDDSGTVVASSSTTLIGTSLEEPALQRALSDDKFGAVAAPVEHDLVLDGVREWEAGDVLYMSLMPGTDASLLFFYDIGGLMGRRVQADGIQPETVQLASACVFFLVTAALSLAGRSRALRRYREMDLEAEYMRKEAEALHHHNAELDEARSKAERALELAEENNRIRSEFVLMINHELRTPLTSVVTGAQLLRTSERLEPDEHEILESLVHDGHRLQSMIDQLLALARVENRGLAFAPQPIVLEEACAIATQAHSRVDHRAGGEAHGGKGEIRVLTDGQTLTQLVASLVDNAYTHGAASVEVECTTEPPDSPQLVVGDMPDRAAGISVIDDGPGIRPDFLPRAFEKFEKDSRSSGTGLGLYMARLMADAIGAALQVRTSPAGTTVSIMMPVADQKQNEVAA